jgi:hypothetical protein
MTTQNGKTLRRGQQYRRISDGYVFFVKSTSRIVLGAVLQCVDASMVFGWFYAEQIASEFERLTAADMKPIAPWVAS